jgi:uncharacterized protein (TIGR02118 family)
VIKLVFCLRRQRHLSREEFQHYWRTVHAPLVAERARRMGVVRYVQSHTFDDAAGPSSARRSPPPFDGIAELWWTEGPTPPLGFDDRALQASRELLEDEHKFIDLASSPIFFTRETEVVGPHA